MLMEAFFVVVVISLLLHGVMELIIRCLVEGYSFLTREKRSRQRAAARRIQKRQEALLLQYVLESEERTKEMPGCVKTARIYGKQGKEKQTCVLICM